MSKFSAARAALASKRKKPVKKVSKRKGGGKAVKVKLKVKGTPEGVSKAVKKLASGIGPQ